MVVTGITEATTNGFVTGSNVLTVMHLVWQILQM